MPTKNKPVAKSTDPASDAQAVFARLERLVRRADAFVLGFVKCNHPSQQKELRREFLARLGDKRVLEVELDKPLVSLLDELTARWDPNSPPDVVCVYGLEKSINELQEASPVLGRLNNDRDLLRRAVPVPLLIWLPDFALDFIARGAPDFWAWRSGVYEFATESALWQDETGSRLSPAPSTLASLSLEQKRVETGRIEELLRTACSLPKPEKREQRIIAGLLYQLGVLYDSLNEWGKARDRFEQGLKILETLCDKPLIAVTLHYLGIVHQHQGDPVTAKKLYQQSLSLKTDWGNQRALVSPYHQLGKIAYEEGNFVEAKDLFNKSLQIAQKVNDQVGMAMGLHHLGMIAHDQGDLTEARGFYQDSLRLSHATNTDDVIMRTVHQLGLLEQDRGNLPEAIRLYKQSKDMSEELGDRYGAGISSYQLGSVYLEQNDCYKALYYYALAWSTFSELRLPETEWAIERMRAIMEQVSPEQFDVWLAEDFGPKAAEIRKRLDEALAVPTDAVRQEPVAVG